MTATWIVERTEHRRFPYRIRIEREGRVTTPRDALANMLP